MSPPVNTVMYDIHSTITTSNDSKEIYLVPPHIFLDKDYIENSDDVFK